MKNHLLSALLILMASFLATFDCLADTYLVAVGINRYQATTSLHVSEKDALDFSSLIKSFDKTHVTTLTGRYATRKNVANIVAREFAKAKPEDAVIFYFSGHGNDGGMMAYDSPSGRTKDMIQYRDIARLMKRSPAKRKLIIVDSCLSGSSRKTSSGKRKHNSTDPNVVMFMSSRADEKSLEAPSTGNSIFTRYLLSGLKGSADTNRDHKVTARELFDYVNTCVRRSTRDLQHPVMWGNFDSNFIISTY